MAFLAAINGGRRGGMTPACQLTASKEFNRFLAENALAFDTESSIAWLMLEAVDTALGDNARVPRVRNDQDVLCARSPVAAGAAANAQGAIWNGLDAGDPPAALMEAIPPLAFRQIRSDSDKAIFWLLDLVACHQVKPLKASNIANFFRMGSRVSINGREILKVLDYAAVALPNVMGDADLMNVLSANQFMTYHTAYSSSAKLAAEMLESAPAITNTMFTAASRLAVTNSSANPQDRGLNGLISQQVLLATYAYLEAFGKLPDNWFQGEKAKQALPASKFNLYKAIFRRLRELSANTDAINGAATVAALIELIDPSIQNV